MGILKPFRLSTIDKACMLLEVFCWFKLLSSSASVLAGLNDRLLLHLLLNGAFRHDVSLLLLQDLLVFIPAFNAVYIASSIHLEKASVNKSLEILVQR